MIVLAQPYRCVMCFGGSGSDGMRIEVRLGGELRALRRFRSGLCEGPSLRERAASVCDDWRNLGVVMSHAEREHVIARSASWTPLPVNKVPAGFDPLKAPGGLPDAAPARSWAFGELTNPADVARPEGGW